MRILRWLISSFIAFLFQVGVDWILPADTDRVLVIMAGGVAALIWSRLDSLTRELIRADGAA